MDTLEILGKRIATTEDLNSIVHTMKSLSAVSIRQYDQAVPALREYNRTIEMGLQVVLRTGHTPLPPTDRIAGGGHRLRLGSRPVRPFQPRDRPLRPMRSCRDRHGRPRRGRGLPRRGRTGGASELEATGEQVVRQFRLPGSVAGLADTAHDILLDLDRCGQPARRGAGAPVPQSAAGRRRGGTLRRAAPAALCRDGCSGSRRGAGGPAACRPSPWTPHLCRGAGPAAPVHRAVPGRGGIGASEHAMRLVAMQAAQRNIEETISTT